MDFPSLECSRQGEAVKLKDAMKELQHHSLRLLSNPLHKAPIGETESVGAFALVWPEIMHQTESGTMKDGIKCLVEGVQLTGKGEEGLRS